MERLRVHLRALATYRYLPYALAFVFIVLRASGVEAAEDDHTDGEYGLRCFICGCSVLSHAFIMPKGCQGLIGADPLDCWIHEGEWCSWIWV